MSNSKNSKSYGAHRLRKKVNDFLTETYWDILNTNRKNHFLYISGFGGTWLASNSDLSVQRLFFGTRLELFLQDVYENNVPPDQPWYGTSWQVLLELT